MQFESKVEWVDYDEKANLYRSDIGVIEILIETPLGLPTGIRYECRGSLVSCGIKAMARPSAN